MRILFLTDNFPPEVNAPANRTYEHCREWVKAGAQVTVITCAPNFPKGKVYPGYKNKFYSKEEIDGIKVIRVWTYITANEGFVKRILDYISFAFMSFWFGLFSKTDLIVATSPQFFTAVSGWLLGFFKRKKWVMEVRDLWPESIVAVGAMKNKFILGFFERLEKRLYKSAFKIVVVTDSFKGKIIEKGIDATKIAVFKNGALLEKYVPQEKDNNLLEELGLKNKFIFSYIGTHGLAHALDFIINSINEIKESHPEIHFIFIGDGAKRYELIQLKEDLNCYNLTMLESVPKIDVIKYLNLMDVALVNLKKSDTFKTVIPSKIFEAAAVRKPILLGLEGETKKLVSSYNVGMCFEPENKDEFIKTVIEIYSNQTKYQEFVKNTDKFKNDFDRRKIANDMYSFLNQK